MTPVYKKHKVRNWSASQYDSFKDCKRKWFFKSILKVEAPQNASALRGENIHKALEDTENTNGSSDPGEWLTYVEAVKQAEYKGENLIIFPKEEIGVEMHFSLPTHTGHKWQGKIDHVRLDRRPLRITDWKTSSTLNYAKTPADLISDIQINCYAENMYQKGYPDDQMIEVGNVLIEVRSPPPKKVLPRVLPLYVELDRNHVRRVWESTKPQLDDMLVTSEIDDFQNVEPNTQSCNKYGGCPYRAQCGISVFADINNVGKKQQTESIMGFLDKVKTNGNGAAKTAPSQAPIPPVVQTPPAPATPPVAASGVAQTPAASGNSFLAKLRSAGTVPAVTQPTAHLSGNDPMFGLPTGIVPPDAPPRDSIEPLQAGDPGMKKEKRGRRTKAEMEAARLSGGSEAVAEVLTKVIEDIGDEEEADEEAAALVSAPVRAPAPKTTKAKEFVIYMDCMVTKGAGDVEPTTLEDFFGPIEMELNEWAMKEKNLPHYYLSAFGEQKAVLSIAIQDKIKKGLPSSMLVRSSSPLARDVLQFLLPHASQVVSALRG